MMTNNPILDELHAARQKLLDECGGDTAEYLRQAAERLQASGRPIAKLKQRTIRCNGAANSDEPAVENFSSPPADR